MATWTDTWSELHFVLCVGFLHLYVFGRWSIVFTCKCSEEKVLMKELRRIKRVRGVWPVNTLHIWLRCFCNGENRMLLVGGIVTLIVFLAGCSLWRSNLMIDVSKFVEFRLECLEESSLDVILILDGFKERFRSLSKWGCRWLLCEDLRLFTLHSFNL